MPLEVRVVHETDAITIAVAGPYCLGRWRGVPDVAGLRAMHDALSRWLTNTDTQVDRFVAINVVDAHAIIRIPEEARREVARIQESFNDKQVGLATVLPARGFFAAAVRGIVSAVTLMSRASFPQQVFDDQLAACRFAATQLGRDDAIDVMNALASLEAQPLKKTAP